MVRSSGRATRQRPGWKGDGKPRARRDARPRGVLIQSLQRGLGILETVADRGAGITMAEVSRAIGLHASTTFHLLRTLVALGYVAQDEATRQYRLGPKAFRIAASGWGERQLAETAAPFLRELARETGETSHLAVFERGEVVVIDKVDGLSPVRLAERVGYPRPAHCTAIGKVLLAHLPERDLAAFLAGAALEAMTPRTITSAARLGAELRRVRARGYAFDNEEFTRGICCLAASVRNFTGRVVAAVGISGPIWRVDPERVAALAKLVTRTAGRLTAQLGGPGAAGDGKPRQTVTFPAEGG